MRLVAPDRYQALKASGKLPSPRGVAFAIIDLLRHEEYRLEELTQLVQSDPAIAGRLLRFANAAAVGTGRPIVSLSKAVTVLGAFRVRDLVLGFSVLHNHLQGECSQFNYSRFWSRSLATAIAAQALASHARIAAEESFTAGLLSNIGELALVSVFPDEYGEVAVAPPPQKLALEQQKFSTDHREVGATLLLEWGLPEPLANAVYHCETPDSAGHADGSRLQLLTLALHVAQALADICVAADAERWSLVPELYSKAARLGIGTDELTRLADNMTAEWHEWGKTLTIRTHDIPPFADLLTSSPPRETENSQAQALASLAPESLSLIVGMPGEAATLAQYLGTNGYLVARTGNLVDGLVMALRDAPRLLFLEQQPSTAETTAFCRALRDNQRGQDIYLIVTAHHGDEDQLAEALDAGADDFLLHPVSEASLRARLRTVEKNMQLHEAIRRERIDQARSAGEWAGTQRRLIQVAMTDPLTHLPNRRHGMDFLNAEWVFATSNNLPLACMMIDIDHFKRVNDTYGHKAGDTILAAVARMLQASARAMDMVFRYGGEEFCMVCPGADLDTAVMIAERIRQAAEAEPFNADDKMISVTLSIGTTALTAHAADHESLIKEADTALYKAKQSGRNRVCRFSPEPD